MLLEKHNYIKQLYKEIQLTNTTKKYNNKINSLHDRRVIKQYKMY